MNLPVGDIESALPFYEGMLGFRLLSRGDVPCNFAVIGRDQIQIRLCENGRDPTQDGCAFHVTGLDGLLEEFRINGVNKEISDFSIEQRDTGAWSVFYVVAPDGLCFWFGEQQPA